MQRDEAIAGGLRIIEGDVVKWSLRSCGRLVQEETMDWRSELIKVQRNSLISSSVFRMPSELVPLINLCRHGFHGTEVQTDLVFFRSYCLGDAGSFELWLIEICFLNDAGYKELKNDKGLKELTWIRSIVSG
ncbi:unnamed protein product [Vicia faba]|uniref:Uncharacterized protein n=1 Tax=Vicia faba TaxID=3906 RepID=A0AAV0ZRM8_VICFA|nr:unnamed protein product [Vicia faba]